MSNLEQAVKEMSSKEANEIVANILIFTEVRKYSNGKQYFTQPGYELLSELIYDIGNKFLGASTGSSAYDNGLFTENHVIASSDYYDNETNVSATKDDFTGALLTTISQEPLTELPIFVPFYKFVKENNLFTGTEEELNMVLKKSSHFSDMANELAMGY